MVEKKERVGNMRRSKRKRSDAKEGVKRFGGVAQSGQSGWLLTTGPLWISQVQILLPPLYSGV